MSKQEFLLNMRVARSLFSNQRVSTDFPADTARMERTMARAAIWLTPKSVEHFNAADFVELGAQKQTELQDAVLAFLAIAKGIPPAGPATKEQIDNGKVAFNQNVLQIVNPYLPTPEEGRKIEQVLKTIPFPDWIVSWDYEMASDEDGTPSVWLTFYVDEETTPKGQLGVAAARLTQDLRKGLVNERIDRWPYIRMRSGKEHKMLK